MCFSQRRECPGHGGALQVFKSEWSSGYNRRAAGTGRQSQHDHDTYFHKAHAGETSLFDNDLVFIYADDRLRALGRLKIPNKLPATDPYNIRV